jgi:2'-5' RNA ligase
MRLFVAIDIDEAARKAIAAEQQRIKGEIETGSSLKWIRSEHMHLTLAFIGEVEESRAEPLVRAMSAPITGVEPFEIVFGGLGVFPPEGAPRVLWLGVSSGAAQVIDTQAAIADRLARLDVPREPRPFHPHLTLARWRDGRPRDRRRINAVRPSEDIGRTHVNEVTLYESRLSSAGPAYTAVARAGLL